MIQKIQINGVLYEIDYYCTASLAQFGDADLEVEQITNLSTNEVLDYDAQADLITPEIEDSLIAHYLDNYDPTE